MCLTLHDLAQQVRDIKSPILHYSYEALEPALSERALHLHHDHHYAGYVERLRDLVRGTPFEEMTLEQVVQSADGAIFNNAAQAWNHAFYFEQFAPPRKSAPEGALLAAIEKSYGSGEELIFQMTNAATSLFGSGWVWLVDEGDGQLTILSESNAGTPIREGMRPLLTIDVWEHAYYVDYENRRGEAVNAFWGIVNWAVVERRFSEL